MAKIKVDMTPIDKMIGKLRIVRDMFGGSGGKLSPVFKSALDRVGERILKTVKEETPVGDSTRPDFHEGSQFHTDKTHLRDAWRWKLDIKGRIIEGYAFVTPKRLDNLIDLLEAGSPPHLIVSQSGGVLRFYIRSGGGWEQVYAKSVKHPGFSANKFTGRAQSKANVHIKELVTVLQSEINRIILGK